MKNTAYLPPHPTFTLPEQLDKFTEEAAEDIKTPKIKDFLLSRLKEDAWNRYQNELQNGFDKDQAQTRTLKDLGDIQTVKARLLKEAEEQKNQENSILWKVPLTAAILFSVVACISLISCILYQINGRSFLTMFFPEDTPAKEIYGVTGITTYGNLIGSSFLWLFLSLLCVAICLALTFHLKKKYPKANAGNH